MLGTKLHEAIKNSGMNMEEVANHLGISSSNLFKIIKKDSFEVSYLLKASELFNLPLSYFLEGTTLYEIGNSTVQTGSFNQAGNSNSQKIKTSKAPSQELATELAACQRELEVTRALVASKDELISFLRGTYTRPN